MGGWVWRVVLGGDGFGGVGYDEVGTSHDDIIYRLLVAFAIDVVFSGVVVSICIR